MILQELISTNVQSPLPTIGAAIIFLSLPLDGLFQRVVSYPMTANPDSSNAIVTLSRAILYDPMPETIWVHRKVLMPPDVQLELYIWPFWQGDGLLLT